MDRNEARRLDTVTVLEKVKARPDVAPFALVVGRWVWVEFESKPKADTRDFLRGLGFHWNRKRRAWQHPCGRFSRKSPGNPKDKYGAEPVGAAVGGPTGEDSHLDEAYDRGFRYGERG